MARRAEGLQVGRVVHPSRVDRDVHTMVDMLGDPSTAPLAHTMVAQIPSA